MNKLKQTILAAAMTLPVMSMAADYPWLTFRMADDTEISVSADNLAMNYKDGYLQLNSSSVDKAIPVDQIKSMKFTSYSAGIQDIIDAQADGEYYNLSGICVGRYSSVENARKALPSGIYIVKSEKKTFKVTL